MGLAIDQTYQLVAVDELLPHPDNPRRGDVDSIAGSIADNGWYGAVVAQRSTGHVLAGNHRLAAARRAGADVVPVLWLEVDDDRARRILLADNRTNDLAGYDQAQLAAILEDLTHSERGLAGTAFAEQAVAEILAAAATPAAETDVDDAPDLPAEAETISVAGDTWVLGPHRLVCGNATDLDAVLTALDNEPAAMVFTDPPYGVSYQGGTAKKLTIANDDLSAAALAELLDGAFGVLRQVLRPGGAFYVCSPSGVLESTFRAGLARADLHLRTQIVWVKDRFVLGRADYHGQHETMLYGWQLDGEPAVPPHFDPAHDTLLYGWAAGAAHHWDGGRKQSTVWDYPRPARSAIHPTMKPVDLVRRAIENSTPAGALILDTFGGSGTTLIAAHHASRRAALVELDPGYVDVICRRWQEHTGDTPRRQSTGEAVSFLEAA